MTEWHTLHVHYQDESQDSLLLHRVGPLLRRLRTNVPDAYFLPHRDGGPHIRLNFRTTKEEFEHRVVPAAEEIVGPEALTRAEYDGWIGFEEAPAMAELRANYHIATTPLVLSIIEHTGERQIRMRIAFAILLASVHAYFPPDGLATGHLPLRSPAERFLNEYDEDGRVREQWEARYAKGEEFYRRELRDALELVENPGRAAEGGDTRRGLVADWIRHLRPVERRAWELRVSGDFPAPELTIPEPGSAAWHRLSDFHRAMFGDPRVLERLRTDPVVVFQSVLTYSNANLVRIGVDPMERYALIYLAGRAAEDHYGPRGTGG